VTPAPVESPADPAVLRWRVFGKLVYGGSHTLIAVCVETGRVADVPDEAAARLWAGKIAVACG
jgi:hypothetical protein